jgi:hypothetical protein
MAERWVITTDAEAGAVLDTSLTANSDSRAPSQKAVKSYVDVEITARESAIATEKTRAEAAEGLKLAKASNLSDLASALTARYNLGVETRSPWSYRDHGLNACSMNDPVTATTAFASLSGQPIYTKIPVRVASVNFATVRLIIAAAGTGATSLANCFVGVYSSTGTRLGVSADQSVAWATTGEKAIAIVADEGKSPILYGV